MKFRNIVLTFAVSIALLFSWAKAYAGFDYLSAGDGVSFSHAHIQRTGGELVDDPNSNTGSSWINTTMSNIEETNRIPLIKGHGFHVQLMLFKLPADTSSIQLSFTHPPMTLPSGEVLDEQAGAIPTQAAMGLFPEASFSYTLDEDYELVEGDWILTFSHLDEQLFEITFTTYIPDGSILDESLGQTVDQGAAKP